MRGGGGEKGATESECDILRGRGGEGVLRALKMITEILSIA